MTERPSDSDDRTGQPDTVGGRMPDWGPLTITERLDAGSSSTLYRARHTILGRDVALRLFDTADPDEQQRLLEAGRRMAGVRHPNIVQVLGVDSHDGVAGVWSELAAGETLADIVGQNGPTGPDKTSTLGRELCSALTAIHAAGLHCGHLDPGNIVQEEDGRVRLDYFGPAAETPFPAPELSGNGAADSRSDVYTLGVLLYRLATGTYPPPGDRGFLPEALVACLDRAVAENPDNRFQTAADFSHALAGISKRPVSRIRRISGITIILALSVFVILQWPSQYRLESVLYRVDDDDTRTRLSAGAVVARGDCLALDLDTTLPMYVYVFSENAAGAATARFPLPTSEVENPLAPDVTHNVAAIRGQGRCWRVARGGEFTRVHILTSPEKVPEFRALYLELPQTGISDVSVTPLIEMARDLDATADAAIAVTYSVIELGSPEAN